MFQHILVPLDEPPADDEVLALAAHLARTSQGTITLLRVIPTAQYIGPHLDRPQWFLHRIEAKRQAALSKLEALTQHPVLGGVSVRCEVFTGPVVPNILEADDLFGCDLILMRGRPVASPFGRLSITEQVAQQAITSVLTIHSHIFDGVVLGEAAVPRVLIALDGTSRDETVMTSASHFAAQLSLPHPACVHLVRVMSPSPHARATHSLRQQAVQYLTPIAQRLREVPFPAWSTRPQALVLQATEDVSSLQRLAETGEGGDHRGYAVLVLGTNPRNGLAPPISASLLRMPSCAVLTVPPTEEPAALMPPILAPMREFVRVGR